MADSDIVIPSDIQAMISERNQIRASLAQSERELASLQKSQSQLGAKGTVSEIAALTSNPIPANELTAALSQVQNELNRIGQIDREIASENDAIRIIRQRNIVIIGALVVAGLLVILFLLHLVGVF